MQVQHVDEFKKLFQEFKDTFVNTSEGQEHIGFYERDRQQGTANFRAVEAAFQQQGITSHAQMTDALTEQVLRTLLPHSDTATHRDGGYWIHRAPAIQGDIKDWYGARGGERDWKAIAHAIFHFVKACIDYSGDQQLRKICHHFSQLTYTTGFQSGFLTPILNSVSPDRFLLINSKPKKAITYFFGEQCPTQIVEYPFANKNAKACTQAISSVMHSIDNSLLSDADQFDMFCHWLVSIKKFDFKSVAIHYWKIAPGESAWQWDECRKQGFIGIGWDELGDLTNLSHEAFNARRDDLIKTHTGWKKAGVNQVWRFAQLQEGDRIVANRGQSEVVGIGTVTGPYYYQSDAEQYRHRLPVEWNDSTPRDIKHLGFKWVPTLIELNAQEFDEIVQAPKIEEESSSQAPPADNQPMSVNPDCPFNLTTFELLAKLHHTPKKTVYDAHKKDFERYLTTPFKKLMKGVATHLPASIADLMETKVHLFGRILKDDFGRGGAHEHYWGAFYPKGSKKTQDAQLLLIIGHSSLTFGFDIGHHDYQRRERFRQNCQKYHQQLIDLLEPALNNNHLRFGHQSKLTFDENGIAPNLEEPAYEEWLKSGASSGVHVNITLSKGQVLDSSQEDLIQTILQTYQQLFPLVLLAIEDDPLPAILEYLDQEPEPEPNPLYPLSQCAQETYLDESLLNNWVHAIHRKGQAVLYGPPGTGKTYLARRLAQHLISEKDGFAELVQFHPAYTYEDFMQGIRPQRTDDGLDYPTVPGRFLDFCKRARGCQDTCVLIIDEINRANLAQVFGELMYLLEYREDQVALAGGKPFSIPKNVRIIGTMNTADRSIALVDHALRRRFAFLPLYPDMNILRRYHANTGFAVESLIQLIKEVNQAIDDPQYSIGTSFFLDQALESNLKAIWCMEIEPYLQEYFFDQTDKVEEFQWDKISHRVMPS